MYLILVIGLIMFMAFNFYFFLLWDYLPLVFFSNGVDRCSVCSAVLPWSLIRLLTMLFCLHRLGRLLTISLTPLHLQQLLRHRLLPSIYLVTLHHHRTPRRQLIRSFELLNSVHPLSFFYYIFFQSSWIAFSLCGGSVMSEEISSAISTSSFLSSSLHSITCGMFVWFCWVLKEVERNKTGEIRNT